MSEKHSEARLSDSFRVIAHKKIRVVQQQRYNAISSGNSFVHETESQLILSGNRDVNFTMDLIQKDIGLFQAIADRNDVPLELSP